MLDDGFFLTGFYLFHMIASIVYCGCVLQIFIFNQRLQETHQSTLELKFKTVHRKRLITTAWLCLAVIGFTGMFQMSAHPAYEGFLAFHNPWSVAILGKHLLVLVFLGVKAYLTMIQEPNLIRTVFLAEKRKDGENLTSVQVARSENRLILIMAALFVLILLFTSLARTA
jgi:NADH:ubiquinone oxidoreductase subunit 6 (subunit J)